MIGPVAVATALNVAMNGRSANIADNNEKAGKAMRRRTRIYRVGMAAAMVAGCSFCRQRRTGPPCRREPLPSYDGGICRVRAERAVPHIQRRLQRRRPG